MYQYMYTRIKQQHTLILVFGSVFRMHIHIDIQSIHAADTTLGSTYTTYKQCVHILILGSTGRQHFTHLFEVLTSLRALRLESVCATGPAADGHMASWFTLSTSTSRAAPFVSPEAVEGAYLYELIHSVDSSSFIYAPPATP